MKPVDQCGTCAYWQDFSDRVFAKINGVNGPTTLKGIIELRRCRYLTPPSVTQDWDVYTDEEYGCSAHKPPINN